ncbi:MAG: hypothetical protein FWE25_06970 [Lachnospiraceae bacterium]|nr:hypothetical protein [Lachnospiraceae bacterium]
MRKIVILVMVFALLSMGIPVFAQSSSEILVIDLSEEAELEHARQLQEALSELSASDLRQRNATGVQTRHIRTQTHTAWTGRQRAGGQTANGAIFRTPGSGFGWTNGTGGTFSFSFGLNWKAASISVSRGTASPAGAGTRFITVPNNMLNRQVHLYVNHQMQARQYRIYERPNANPNAPWRFVRIITTTARVGESFEVRVR